MKLFRSAQEFAAAGMGPSAVTIGKFDGVHLGHRAIINALRQVASTEQLLSVVLTFDRNPLELFCPENCPEALTSLEQKLELLAETGIDATLVTTFDREFSQIEAEQFVTEYLVNALQVRVVLVGHDFRFGHHGAGDVAQLKQFGKRYGFRVLLIDDVLGETGQRLSSTRIRNVLSQGDVREAARLLGHFHTLRGTVVHGVARGRVLGFPTANLSPLLEGFIPADGVYAGWLFDNGQSHPAAISVGDNPSFEGVAAKQLEAHVIDGALDLYGHCVELAFVQCLRGMIAFDSIDALVTQITVDVEQVRHILGQTPADSSASY